MYRIDRNNYHLKPKYSSIQTPPAVSQFIFELLKDKIPPNGIIFDPCCGKGNLLSPWKHTGLYDFSTVGSDIKTSVFWFNSSEHPRRGGIDFLLAEKSKVNKEFKPALILCNPPFNGMKPKLAPEVWLDKIIELFGKEIPIVLFVPMGFRANLTLTSKRKMKFETGEYPPIVSFISLPKNIFPGVIFHSEILIFNIKGLEGHYFYKERI
ncbi:MAG: putative R/M system DNA methylase [Mycoplasmataceae bacterium RV_VA103A]|nr:MAG: putative R/M system DNA methylase [Mycoplasmataceae bacterium RV_VA103A]